MPESNICYMLVLAVSVGLVVWGFYDLLKKQVSSETKLDVISRQVRGFAIIMLSQVVLLLGSMICLGSVGDLANTAKIADLVRSSRGGGYS